MAAATFDNSESIGDSWWVSAIGWNGAGMFRTLGGLWAGVRLPLTGRRDGIRCCGCGSGGAFRRVNGKSLSFDFSNCSGGCLRRVDGKSLPSDCPGLVGDVLFFLAIFVFVTRSFPSTFFFRGAIIRLLLGFGDPGWNELVFAMDKTNMSGVRATHQEWSGVHHIHNKKRVVIERTGNRACCQKKHHNSYSDVQPYKMVNRDALHLKRWRTTIYIITHDVNQYKFDNTRPHKKSIWHTQHSHKETKCCNWNNLQ